MTRCELQSMKLVSNPVSGISEPTQWKLTFAVLSPAPTEPVEIVFEWAADVCDSSKDQVLDELEVGPLVVGKNEMILEHDGPVFSKLPQDNLLGSTLITAKFLYRGHKFLQCGVKVDVSMKGSKPKKELNKDGSGDDDSDEEEDLPEVIEEKDVIKEIIASKIYPKASEITWDSGKRSRDNSEGQ